MKILIVLSNPYLPEIYCGQNTTVSELCDALVLAGHKPIVVTKWRHPTKSHRLKRDDNFGYPVFRATDPAASLNGVCLTCKPDVALIIDGAAENILTGMIEVNIPVVSWFFAHPNEGLGYQYYPDRIKLISTTRDIAAHVTEFFNADVEIIPPYIILNHADTEDTGKSILFVNPLRSKGIETLFRIAGARPEYHFTILQSRAISDQWLETCFKKSFACGNIDWLPATPEIGKVFSQTRLLLIPRLNPEGFARIITEAQSFGIPALASEANGFAERIGHGGTIIPKYSTIDDWIAVLDQYMKDDEYHATKRKYAIQQSEHEDLRPDDVLTKLLHVMTTHMKQELNRRFYRNR